MAVARYLSRNPTSDGLGAADSLAKVRGNSLEAAPLAVAGVLGVLGPAVGLATDPPSIDGAGDAVTMRSTVVQGVSGGGPAADSARDHGDDQNGRHREDQELNESCA